MGWVLDWRRRAKAVDYGTNWQDMADEMSFWVGGERTHVGALRNGLRNEPQMNRMNADGWVLDWRRWSRRWITERTGRIWADEMSFRVGGERTHAGALRNELRNEPQMNRMNADGWVLDRRRWSRRWITERTGRIWADAVSFWVGGERTHAGALRNELRNEPQMNRMNADGLGFGLAAMVKAGGLRNELAGYGG